MTVRVAIDLNVRVRGNQTYAGFEDADGPLAAGDKVAAFEAEAGVQADATVTEVDEGRRLVYLAMDWHSFRDAPEATEDRSCE